MRKARQKAKEMYEKGLGPNPKDMTNFDLAGNSRNRAVGGIFYRGRGRSNQNESLYFNTIIKLFIV